jgi:signal transduction histidine kinase
MCAGCGTSEFCSTCGAVQVILSGLRGHEDVSECRIATEDRGAYDLLVRSKPLEVAGERFTVFSIRDISHEKRRRLLERLFFHDILNTAGGLRGMSELLDTVRDEEEFTRTKQLIHGLAEELIEEIEAQRDLAAAENDELEIAVKPFEPDKLVERVVSAYRNHGDAQWRWLRTDLPHRLPKMESDPRLLRRILGNMIKNGLEATSSGGTVTVSVSEKSENGRAGIEFSVHNERFMPKRVQLQVFQRSFSTKSDDRGLGTYSMRLLGEYYLGGRVRFVSDEEKGTTFFAWIPLRPEEGPGESSGNGDERKEGRREA